MGKMVNFRSHSYRQGEIILNSKYKIRKEIEDILHSITVEHGERKRRPGTEDPHKIIEKAFMEKGWDKLLVSEKAQKKEYFDLFKDKVAIEVEFSRREFLQRVTVVKKYYQIFSNQCLVKDSNKDG